MGEVIFFLNLLLIPIALLLLRWFARGRSVWFKITVGVILPILVLVALDLGYEVMGVALYSGECKQEDLLGKLTCGIRLICREYDPYCRRMPRDESMIAHFQRNRADFERLVEIYRKAPDLKSPYGLWVEPTPEIRTIMDRVQDSVRKLRDSIPGPSPNPSRFARPTKRQTRPFTKKGLIAHEAKNLFLPCRREGELGPRWLARISHSCNQ